MDIEQLPRLNITLDGAPLAQAVAGAPLALARLAVRQQLSLPAQCELTFSDPPGPLDGVSAIAVGAALRLAVAGDDELLFAGQVTAVEYVYLPSGQNEVRLRAYDRSHALRKRQAVRAHIQLTARELAQELVADLGLTVDATEAGPLQPRLIQHAQSDYRLLVSQLEQAGLYYIIRDQTLHLITLAGLAREAVELNLGETLLEARGEVNSDRAAGQVIATGWSALEVEVYSGDRSQARTGRMATATVSAEAVDGRTARRLVDTSVVSADHLEALAQAVLDHRHAQAATVWGVARGNPALFPGAAVDIRGIAEALAGVHVLTQVTHTVDPELGFVSEFSSAPPTLRPRRSDHIAALGVVSDVDDPDRLGRVRVALPAYDDVETGWLHVIAPAAGPAKGLVMLPSDGDRVLVLFTDREPGQGMVIGGFYAPDPPYDTGVDGAEVRRYSLRTPDGHLLRLDDAGRSLRLEDSHGSYVEMTPDKVCLFANTDLEISAPGRSILIQSNAIDFRRA